MLVRLIVFKRFDEPVKLLFFAALGECPLPGVCECADGGKTRLYGLFSLLVFHFFQTLLKMQFVLLAPSAVVRPRKIVVLSTDLTVLMHANYLKRDIGIGCHRLVVMMRDG